MEKPCPYMLLPSPPGPAISPSLCASPTRSTYSMAFRTCLAYRPVSGVDPEDSRASPASDVITAGYVP